MTPTDWQLNQRQLCALIVRKKALKKTAKNSKRNLVVNDYLILLLVLADQITKAATVKWHLLPIIYNRGISFGLLPHLFWLGINSVILVALIAINYKYNSLPLSMILAGGLANFIDRIARGVIIDFIALPIAGLNFNLADIWITAGVALLIFHKVRP